MKKFLVFLLVLMLCIGSVACGDFGGDDVELSDDESKDININFDKNTESSFNIYCNGDVDGEEETLNAIVEGYKKEYPNMTVNVISLDSYDTNIVNKLRNEGGDLFWAADNTIQGYVDNNMALSLQNVYEREIAAGTFAAEDFYSSMIELSSYRGKLVMAPRQYDKYAVYFNTTIMDALDLSMPADTWTFEDLISLCKQIETKLKSGTYEFTMDNTKIIDTSLLNDSLIYSFLKSFEGGFVKDSGECDFNENTLTAMEKISELLVYAKDPQAASLPFLTGNCVMMINSKPRVATVEAQLYQVLGHEYDFAAFPALNGEKSKIGAGTVGYAVFKNTKKKDECWSFLKYMLSEAGQTAMANTGNGVPVLRSLAENPNAEWLSKPRGGLNVKAFTLYPERDVTVSFYQNLPVGTKSVYVGFLKDIVVQLKTKTPKSVYNGIKRDINDYYATI